MSALVLHLNGPPGVGKSTLARRWAQEHRDTLLLDIDELRTWVSGWSADFVATGARIRPVALSMIRAYAESGHDVVLPQLVADPGELEKFRRAATEGGATYVVAFLDAAPDEVAARLSARPVDRPWLETVRHLVEEAGPEQVERYHERLAELGSQVPGALHVPTRTGDVEGSYDALVAAVARSGPSSR